MNKVLHSHKSDEWSTPEWFFDFYNRLFHFDLDPCSTHDNAKCSKHFTQADNGLSQDWSGHSVFLNPPYSQIPQWLEKCFSSECTAVILLPARTDTKWFHDLILNNKRCAVRFIRGRLKFGDSKNSAPFPSMIVFYNIF